ncbi:MAG: 3-deoxy-7-phosphoheptulonate synthase class II [Phycisphaerae bacterium]|nr:3-deoxy-7-phosphoheptulonate synthase class II [Phycisphaerae bacterium]
MTWCPDSWKNSPCRQQPTYDDQESFQQALGQLKAMPPLVTSWEIESLKSQLAEAARGERFLLQGGDCAERFQDCDSDTIAAKLKILLQMSLVLVHGSRRRIIRVGRFAGQYAKPRSAETELIDGEEMPTYRGDLINKPEPDAVSRRPDPNLLVRGYERAALTLNFIRALIDGGFADLHHPEYWDLDFVHHSPRAEEYQRMVESIAESLRFMETLAGTQIGQINRVDFFTSHEGLVLDYEAAQTREVPHRHGWYDLSTHMPWIGMRTAIPGSGHVEYFRGIRNPIGLKIGPGFSSDDLRQMIDQLHPNDEPGRLTIIHRFGADRVAEELPRLIEQVRASGRTVLFSSDPMHGNTRTATIDDGRTVKTRRFDDILDELEQAFDIHRTQGSHLGGVHFELTGENVTECIGGARGLQEQDLRHSYRSQVDPRLNYEQALEMAMRIAGHMGRSDQSRS